METVGLAFLNLPPPGVHFIPQEGSGANLLPIDDPDTGETGNWYVSDLGVTMLAEADVTVFDEGIEQIGWINDARRRGDKVVDMGDDGLLIVPRSRQRFRWVVGLVFLIAFGLIAMMFLDIF